MAEHPNAALFRRGYAAFQTGDMDTVRALFHPDIVWHVPGENHNSGDHRGVEDVLALFMRNVQETAGTFKVEVHDILANEEHAVALATISASKDGKRLSDRYIHTAHIEEGQLTEAWIFGEHQDEVDDFWG